MVLATSPNVPNLDLFSQSKSWHNYRAAHSIINKQQEWWHMRVSWPHEIRIDGHGHRTEKWLLGSMGYMENFDFDLTGLKQHEPHGVSDY